MKKIDIFDEDNSIIIEDKNSTTTFEFDPSNKRYRSEFSIKNDVFFGNNLYEYKISTQPIEVWIRLIESSSEPPLEYEVKDGVVLEAEMMVKTSNSHKGLKDFYTNSTNQRLSHLKEQVKWQKLNHSAVLFFILARHPEIVSKDNYRQYLRQTEQSIKLGLLKIEEVIKEKDTTGLKIIEGQFEGESTGKQIWYSEIKKDISTEEMKMRHKKVEELYKILFDEKFPEYSGITQLEFESSSEILEQINEILNQKNTPPKIQNLPVPQDQKKSRIIKWSIVIILAIIALSGGIWTAIGVFILGAIIINIFKS